MTRKPHSIRMPDHVWNKFKAITAVKNMDQDQVFNMIMDQYLDTMTGQEKATADALIKVWQKA